MSCASAQATLNQLMLIESRSCSSFNYLPLPLLTLATASIDSRANPVKSQDTSPSERDIDIPEVNSSLFRLPPAYILRSWMGKLAYSVSTSITGAKNCVFLHRSIWTIRNPVSFCFIYASEGIGRCASPTLSTSLLVVLALANNSMSCVRKREPSSGH